MLDALEDFIERGSASLVHESGKEVLLERLTGSASPSPQDGVDILGDILDLNTRHVEQGSAIVAPAHANWLSA
jgi:hypothetical protein